jgi:hypothetical protein
MGAMKRLAAISATHQYRSLQRSIVMTAESSIAEKSWSKLYFVVIPNSVVERQRSGKRTIYVAHRC